MNGMIWKLTTAAVTDDLWAIAQAHAIKAAKARTCMVDPCCNRQVKNTLACSVLIGDLFTINYTYVTLRLEPEEACMYLA
jgi:hypothetical protein